MQVRDVMTHGVIGVTENASVAEAIETMLRSRVSALFVFDAKHALIGILSEGDLLRRSELGTEHKRPRWLEFLLGSGRLAESYAHEHGRKVGEVMTRMSRRSTRDAELSEAVDRMIRRRIKRLPVLRGETVVGVICALRPAQGPSGRDAAREGPASRRRDQGRHPGRARQARLGAARERARRGRERRRHLQRRDHRRTAARRPQGHRREHARLRRRPRPHGLDRAELRIFHGVAGGRRAKAMRSFANSGAQDGQIAAPGA